MSALANQVPWKYDPLPTQRKFHGDMASLFKGFSGPIGSGKSCALTYESLFCSALNPGLLGLLGAPTYPMLRDATQRTLFEVLEEEQILYVHHKSENMITLPRSPYFGSQILLRPMEEFERLRGTNLAWFGMDELTYCPPEAWTRLQGRLRHPKALRRCGFAAWTPNGFDWVYRDFICKPKSGYKAYLASPMENRYVADTGMYDSLKSSYDDKLYQQEVLGLYLSLMSGAVYHAFARDANVGKVAFDPALTLCWSMDFNVNPMSSVLCQVSGKMLHVLAEIILPNSNTESACAEFWSRIEPMLAARDRRAGPLQLNVYGDATGGSRSTAGRSDYEIVRESLRKHAEVMATFFVPPVNPAVKDRVNAVNSKLKNADGLVGMLIDQSCERLLADLEQVVWKVDGSGNTTGEIDKRNPMLTHISDALGYLIAREMPLKAKPQFFSLDPIAKSGGFEPQPVAFESPSSWRIS